MFRVAQARCASRPRRIRTEGVKAALPCLFLFLLAGCTSKNDAAYPSLSPRPVEKIAAEDLSPDDTPAPEPQAVDPAILKRMAAVRAALRQARERLDQAVAAASAPAPEAERGSEQWVDNQVTLSRLLAAQGAVRNAGTDLGAVMSDLAQARVGGAATAEAEAEVQSLQAEVEALLTRGQSEIGRRTP